MHNITESTSLDPSVRKKHDSDSFDGVVAALLGSEAKVEITQIFRPGKKLTPPEQSGATVAEQKPRFMMIKVKDRGRVNQLIKRRTLKEVGYSNVYLTKDMSPEERAAQKKFCEKLRLKEKETYRIFSG